MVFSYKKNYFKHQTEVNPGSHLAHARTLLCGNAQLKLIKPEVADGATSRVKRGQAFRRGQDAISTFVQRRRRWANVEITSLIKVWLLYNQPAEHDTSFPGKSSFWIRLENTGCNPGFVFARYNSADGLLLFGYTEGSTCMKLSWKIVVRKKSCCRLQQDFFRTTIFHCLVSIGETVYAVLKKN